MTDNAVQARPRKNRRGPEKLLHDLVHRRQRFRQLVGGLFVFGMTLAGRPVPTPFWIGVGITVAGMAVRTWASGCVKKNAVLATNGPYALVRHPLYVGNLLICAGFCFASGVWWSVPVALATLLLFYPPAIRYEDRKLRGFFTEQWDAWGPKTPALLPRLSNWRGVKGAEWSFHQSLFKNGEPIYVAIISACLILLWLKLG